MVIRNGNEDAVGLDGWKLVDRAGNTYQLAGTVSGKGKLAITMSQSTMPLNNDGDEVILLDASGVARSRVAYGEGQVRSGN